MASSGKQFPVRVLCEHELHVASDRVLGCKNEATWVIIWPGQLPAPTCDDCLPSVLKTEGANMVVALNTQGFRLLMEYVEAHGENPQTE